MMNVQEKQNEINFPKNFCEFYPKNYIKKNQTSFNEYIPTKQKESPILIPQKIPKQKNKFNVINKTNLKKELNKQDDNWDDEYSGLASKNNKKKEYLNNSNNKQKYNRHSEDNNDFKIKWKTEICHYWEMYGKCKYGNSCAFAHGNEELNKRKMSSSYKTKPCKQFFELGYCTYGTRCQFSHKIPKETNEENKISYWQILKEFNESNNLTSHEIIKRPRLRTFEDITKISNEIKEKNRLALYEDILELKKKENEENDNKVFSEDTDDGNSISNELNNLINIDEDNFDFNIDDYTCNENNNNDEIKEN